MKIGIIGTGRMGGALGTLWAAKKHHQIFFGSRNRMKAESLAQIAGSGGFGGTYQEAVEFGDVVVLALPWHAVEGHLQTLQPFLDNKILVDITNPVTPAMDGMAIDGNTSGAQIIQSMLSTTKVVKAFNGVHYQALDNPTFGSHTGQVFYCSDFPEASAIVRNLITDLDFTPFDVGELANARHIEAMVYVWALQMRKGKVEGQSTILNIVSR